MATETTAAGYDSNIFALLENRDQIYIQQVGAGRECLEMITGCEISNRFEIKASHDEEPFFKLYEDSNCLARQCCKGIHPFNMNLILPEDDSRTPQIMYRRPFRCTNVQCLCPCGYLCNPFAAECCCGRQELEISTGGNHLIGRVKEQPKAWIGRTRWCFYDELDQPKFVCTVTCCEMCKMCCCNDVTFDVTNYGEPEVVATLARKCICTFVNVATDIDHFEVKFNDGSGLNAMDKFSIMSIAILVKYAHFEESD